MKYYIWTSKATSENKLLRNSAKSLWVLNKILQSTRKHEMSDAIADQTYLPMWRGFRKDTCK